VDIGTGKETRLTNFEYMYMNSVCYFPDDEKFLYQAEGPFAFPGLKFPKDAEGRFQDVNAALAMIGEEAHKRKIYLVGILTMKRGDLFPQRPYVFDEFNPKSPLLSKDGTRLFVEAAGESGKFYLYSPDGNHKHVGGGGSVESAAISPDGELLGAIVVKAAINIYRTQDGKMKVELDLPCAFKEDENGERIKRQREKLYGEKYTMIPEIPSRIINR
jgi:hypothetical protein